jgi:hypothetical protein
VNNSLSRVKLRFAGLEIEFTDRDRGIQQVLEILLKSIFNLKPCAQEGHDQLLFSYSSTPKLI